MTFNASGNNVPIDTSSVMPFTGIGMRKFLAISCAMIAGYSIGVPRACEVICLSILSTALR